MTKLAFGVNLEVVVSVLAAVFFYANNYSTWTWVVAVVLAVVSSVFAAGYVSRDRRTVRP